MLELQYDDDGATGAVPPLGDYRPGPHGHRPYLTAIDALVRELAGDDLVQVSAAQVSVGGRRCTDYVLAGDLTGLPAVLDDDQAAALTAGAAAAIEAIGPHGAFAPDAGGLPWDRTFHDIGRQHTGAPFHDLLIEPLAAKALPGGTSSVIAALHRKIWLPLFHPVTAWEASADRLTYRPERPFWSVAGGGMGEVVRRLVQRVTDAPLVRVRHEGPLVAVAAEGGRTLLRFESGAELPAATPVLGVGPEELFAAAGQAYAVDKVPAAMVWIDVPDGDVHDLPSVLFSAEPEVGAFRVTESLADVRPGFRTVCVEVACTVERERWEATAQAALEDLGVVRPGAAVEVVAAAGRPAFAVPSAASRAAFAVARAGLDALHLPALVVGGATAFAVDSFNEQVVQGLAAAEARSA
ncbi:hypothetical protein KSP35_02340 [Aquihabitans sp. G128]|uniref:hypothetical protein n=1 Tax=Aquihabitans sp. G128 TaxID=2849779 RepID=UPI001C228057|nr:hypothetical protein [Aquihabitans sp. G128]QXC61706.1 hypothetical protein KSP35_02340 [Aquihabitans sp. G128]